MMQNTASAKKVSTEQNGQPALTVGLDVSDRKCQVCALDAGGEVMFTSVVALTEAALTMQFKGLEQARIVFEVGGHSRWLSSLFEDMGHEVIVANPRQLALISQNNRKSDKADAELLARLGRMDVKLLRPVAHRSAAAQAGLSIVRSRAGAVRCRTLLINTIRGQVKAAGGRIADCDAKYFHERCAAIPAELKPALQPLVAMIQQLSKTIDSYDEKLERDADTLAPGARRLTTISGVGILTAISFTLVIDDPARFTSSRAVGPYLGLVPRRSQSGEIDKAMRISKAGDPYTRQLLVQCAQSALRKGGKDSELRTWGQRLAGTSKVDKRRATIAVARKLAVLMHRMLVTGEDYDPNYEANRKEKAAAKNKAA